MGAGERPTMELGWLGLTVICAKAGEVPMASAARAVVNFMMA